MTYNRKKILIISPHFPPSNLAAVHRSRLFAQHLPALGWDPIVLTVDEKYYEEKPDKNLEQILPANLRIEKVKAFPLTRPRIFGDLGMRALYYLYQRAATLIRNEKIDFLYILIPSFYSALLGRWLHAATGVKYGIDYIDPWVHFFPGSEKKFSRHWWSTKAANFLEPIAVKNASLITGVAEGYFSGVLDRNPSLRGKVITGAMPYGGESTDHSRVREMKLKPYLFNRNNGKFLFVYAGAMLPKAYKPLEEIFKSISEKKEIFNNVEFHFIGTGKRADDPESYNIKPLAEKYGLWMEQIFEYPGRIPYLDVLIHLESADAVFILGSTEPHYTPSKVYQGVLSGKPVFAILHQESTAVSVLRKANAGLVLSFDGEKGLNKIRKEFVDDFETFLTYCKSFNPSDVNYSSFNEYSAKNVTEKLVSLLNKL